MTAPTADKQVEFLANLQRVLAEGSFVATYKHALLLALADLAVEIGDDSGDPLVVPVNAIAEKFVAYYWRQVVPFPGSSSALSQATGRPAEILTRVDAAHQQFKSLARIRGDERAWARLVGRVARIVNKMPLWKLQTIGSEPFEFLYANKDRVVESIELRPGVAFCLRRFHGLIEDLLRGAWVRFVRGLKENRDALGELTDLDEFLFGSEREDLSKLRPVLFDIQSGACFYCGARLTDDPAVDHFIPWARYPVDLAHNFVLAHAKCNGKKGDRLAAYDHLAQWCERDRTQGEHLDEAFKVTGFVADRNASKRITRWAYEQAEATKGLVWVAGDELVDIDRRWRDLRGLS